MSENPKQGGKQQGIPEHKIPPIPERKSADRSAGGKRSKPTTDGDPESDPVRKAWEQNPASPGQPAGGE